MNDDNGAGLRGLSVFPGAISGSPAIDINIPGYAVLRKLHF